MNAVGKLGGYLFRGVVTFSAPFSGAVDIVVVQQQDGSYKSSPWYIQFGKYQGALQASDKVVNVNVNGVDADFLMYLDGEGRACFLREVDGDEGMSEFVSSSGDSTDGSSTIRPQKIMSLKLDSESEAKNKKIMTRSSSIGPRVLGYVFGRRSWKENGLQHRENIVAKDIEASLEHAEMTADLLEVRWSTSLVTRKHRKNIAGGISDQRSSRRPHDKGEAEIPLSSSPANYMESFTLKETYFDVNVLESSVGSDGGDTETNSNSVKSDSGVMSGGDEQSSTSQAVRTGDERRMERVESSLYCDTSENFMDELDGSSGESSEDLRLISPVSGKMDVPTGPYGHEKLVFEMNSESPSSILACELFINTDPCISVDGSSSDSGIGSDVETLLETKVAVVLERETNEGPVRYLEEMVVDHISSSEEVTSSIVESLENLRSQKTSDPTSTHLYKIVSCENNENPVGNTKTSNRDAFKVLTTNAGVTEKTDGGQFVSSDHVSYELQKIESMAYMSADSDTEESNSLHFGESSEYKVGLSTEKRNATQFFVSDLDGSELTKTNDTQATTLNSLETENDSQYKPKSKEKLGESTGMLKESHSFPVHTIGIAHEQVGQTAQRVKSLPNIWSHEAGMNAQGTNHPISCSLDSSFDNMRSAQAGVPTTSETGEKKRHSTARPSSMDHTPITEALKKVLSNPAVEVSLCRHLLYEGMGQEATAEAFEAEKLDLEKLVSLDSDIIRDDRVVVRIGDHYFSWDAALPIISAIGSSTGGQILEPKGMITVDQFENYSESMNSRPSIATIATASPRETTGVTDSPKSESIKKRMVWSKTPTSEQLASLNLKDGRNDVTFTFSTPTIGEQKVDARIYLWKWNANIVISDVDGTITKSDVLGQFMPLVGVDWSQPGVAHLFSAIKENGYELLFLSARAISQASLTRQFLCNLKQDGKALPEGPVIISPDGLLPSLYREVIIRAPHKFKIACLEDIRALFPPDHNPFYAGFGNRDTDELSYVKVGVPAGKVFIINPKGEVAVQRRVDRKTYTSLKTIVHEMFPPPSSDSSSVKEDFNEFHFWRLPPSEIVD